LFCIFNNTIEYSDIRKSEIIIGRLTVITSAAIHQCTLFEE